MEADNSKCELPVENITFKLCRRVTASAGHHRLNLPIAALTTMNFPGIEAGGKQERVHRELDLNHAREHNRYAMQKQRNNKPPYSDEDMAIYQEPL